MATRATKVTVWPKTEGLGLAISVVVVAAWTVRVKLSVASGRVPLAAVMVNG